jgi:hypothetical protein
VAPKADGPAPKADGPARGKTRNTSPLDRLAALPKKPATKART